jgi:hypothetical protein
MKHMHTTVYILMQRLVSDGWRRGDSFGCASFFAPDLPLVLGLVEGSGVEGFSSRPPRDALRLSCVVSCVLCVLRQRRVVGGVRGSSRRQVLARLWARRADKGVKLCKWERWLWWGGGVVLESVVSSASIFSPALFHFVYMEIGPTLVPCHSAFALSLYEPGGCRAAGESPG